MLAEFCYNNMQITVDGAEKPLKVRFKLMPARPLFASCHFVCNWLCPRLTLLPSGRRQPELEPIGRVRIFCCLLM